MSGVELLLDTNLIIGLLKAHPPAIALLQREAASLQRSAYSAITRMELLSFPNLQEGERKEILRLLDALAYFPIDRAIEDRAIEIRGRGHLKLPDAIVLATAEVHGLKLLTLDQRLQRVSPDMS